MSIQATVSGSFKFLKEIRQTIRELQDHGIIVLSPRRAKVRGKVGDFVVLQGDLGDDPNKIERSHLEAIGQSDFLYVVSPNGYLRPSSALEIGFALANFIPVFSAARAR